MRKLSVIALPLLAMLAAVPWLASCNTTAGAGRDISNTGQAIENSAEKHSP